MMQGNGSFKQQNMQININAYPMDSIRSGKITK